MFTLSTWNYVKTYGIFHIPSVPIQSPGGRFLFFVVVPDCAFFVLYSRIKALILCTKSVNGSGFSDNDSISEWSLLSSYNVLIVIRELNYISTN